jgi:C-terminal processing protease CtpA/Prc
MNRAARASICFLLLLTAGLILSSPLFGEKKAADGMTSIQRDQALQMLQDTYEKIRKEYYDPTFHGIDLDARYKEAQQKIRAAQSLSQAFGDIAWMVDGLNDSHHL